MDRSLSGSRRRAHRSGAPLAVAAVVTALLLVLAACSGSEEGERPEPTTPEAPAPVPPPDAPRPRRGGVLRVASAELPADWSPTATVWDASAHQVARALYDRLAVYDVNNLPRPQLAESIEADPDFTRWVITVRDGITFHDGTPLDAAVVRANLEAQRTSPVGAELLAPVASITVADPMTVVVTTFSPWSTFAEVLTTQIGTIASPATLVAAGAAAPIGTGPFRVAAATDVSVPLEAGEVRLERNPMYWQTGLPHLDGVRFLPHAEPQARVAAVVTDAADLVVADRPNQLLRLERAAADDIVRLVEDRNAEAPKVAVALNTGRAPFDQIAARRAVALATDRSELVELALEDQGTMARGIISDPSPWFTDLPEPVPDTNKARDQARSYREEFGEPVAFELLVTDEPLVLYTAALWRAQLQTVGIQVQLRQVTDVELADLVLHGQYQAAMVINFTAPHPDLYEPLFRGIPGEQPAVNPNITRYVNLVVTESFADARATSDVAEQVEEYRLVQEALWTDLPWLFLVQLRQVVAVDPAVRDLVVWTTAHGEQGLGIDGGTVSLAQIWIDPAASGATSTTTSSTATSSTTTTTGAPVPGEEAGAHPRVGAELPG